MRSWVRVAVTGCVVMLACACGGAVREGASTAGDSGRGSAPGGEGGSATVPSPVVAPVKCVVATGPDPAPVGHGCTELRERLVVTDPHVRDDDGDGRFAPGERVHVTVSLTDRSGFGYNNYPGLTMESVDPSGRTSVFSRTDLYAILECQSYPIEAVLTLPTDLANGATVKVVARVMSLAGCDGTDTLTIPIVVD